MFGCSLSLSPFIVLVINLLDVRVDAKRLLWLYRRPVGYKAKDIGSWLNICKLLTLLGIINQGFIIGFASNWSISYLEDSNLNRLIFVLVFEV